ncbi:MAG: hypothetical protein EZS26_002748 [Candidatus Ordinivivax streblomastigis]|uniref:Uncharacterized protein n=1 Tax=Candidatus Ordinivivax streblomastigis TaxID=2540710 RepID=A0A5M8NWQ2_9BACT|nr:MAG: hypothetical protein EZS26_002748 [Candidatus Ordinivivax streblomastigis]
MAFKNKYIIFTLSFERIKQGKFQSNSGKKMQRNSTYPSSISPVIRGLREFGMIFAERERERERERESYLISLRFIRARVNNNFSKLIYSRNMFLTYYGYFFYCQTF